MSSRCSSTSAASANKTRKDTYFFLLCFLLTLLALCNNWQIKRKRKTTFRKSFSSVVHQQHWEKISHENNKKKNKTKTKNNTRSTIPNEQGAHTDFFTRARWILYKFTMKMGMLKSIWLRVFNLLCCSMSNVPVSILCVCVFSLSALFSHRLCCGQPSEANNYA